MQETSLSSVNDHQWTVLWWPMTPISSHYCPVLRLLPKQLNLPLHFPFTHVTLLTDTVTAYVIGSQDYFQGDNSTWD